jgi:transposase
MRKIKEVLRLHFESRLSERQISKVCVLGKGTVRRFLKRAEGAGLSWPLPPGLDDAALEKQLFPPPPPPSAGQRPQPDYAAVHKELKGPNVTLQLLWEEYKQEHPDGYSYSRFSELYGKWSRRLDLVLRQDHGAGEKMFVDHAGQTVSVIDKITGETRDAYIFVAVLGASNYTYAGATWTRGLRDWISSHVRAFEFFQGCTPLVVPDNWKSGVRQPCYYEPELNPTYNDLAVYYGVGILPARPYHARDKAYVSHCTSFRICGGEDGLLGRAAAVAFENGALFQRLV